MLALEIGTTMAVDLICAVAVRSDKKSLGLGLRLCMTTGSSILAVLVAIHPVAGFVVVGTRTLGAANLLFDTGVFLFLIVRGGALGRLGLCRPALGWGLDWDLDLVAISHTLLLGLADRVVRKRGPAFARLRGLVVDIVSRGAGVKDQYLDRRVNRCAETGDGTDNTEGYTYGKDVVRPRRLEVSSFTSSDQRLASSSTSEVVASCSFFHAMLDLVQK